jgi:aryl-alcohol dehydrogenase-like predicted oxidoreductase
VYGVLSRGLLSGRWSAEREMSSSDFRLFSPRFQGGNLALVERLREVGDAHDASATQVAIAWVLTRGEDIVPLVGARRRDPLDEAFGSVSVRLSAADLERIEDAMPAGAAAGTRYRSL